MMHSKSLDSEEDLLKTHFLLPTAAVKDPFL